MRVVDGYIRIEGDPPEWRENPESVHSKSDTTHLPYEVVEQPFYLAVEAITEEHDHRHGGLYVAMRIGDDDNRTLSEDEKVYVLEQVRCALDML